MLIAVVVMCGNDEFIHNFMFKASNRDMIDGGNGQFMYLSVRTVHSNALHPWAAKQGRRPRKSTLAAYRNLIQVMQCNVRHNYYRASA